MTTTIKINNPQQCIKNQESRINQEGIKRRERARSGNHKTRSEPIVSGTLPVIIIGLN
jgi:hypothetical protein